MVRRRVCGPCAGPLAGAVLRLVMVIHCGRVSISLAPSSAGFPCKRDFHGALVKSLGHNKGLRPSPCSHAPSHPHSWHQCAALRAGARTALRESESRHGSGGDGLNRTARAEQHGLLEKGRMGRIRKLPIFVGRFDREIVSMAIPSYTAVMLDPIATIIDVSFIGRLPDSTLSLGGMGVSNTILNYFGFTFFFIVVTTTTTLAQTLAQAAVVTATARRVGQQESAVGDAEGGEREAKQDSGDGVTMAGSLWGTPRASGVLGQDRARSAVDVRRHDASSNGEEAAGEDARVDVEDLSEEGKAAGSQVIAGAMIVATSMGVVSAALSWYFAPQLVTLVSGGSF